MGPLLVSFPGPRAAFGCTKEREGPGMFPHVCDVKGRKDLIECGRSGSEQQEELRYQVAYHAYLASGERHTPSIERVLG